MKLPRLALCAFLLACFTCSTLVAQNPIVENPYYPFKVNTTWTYKSSDGKQVVIKVTKHEKVGNILCARVEGSQDGKILGAEDVAVTSEGICRFQPGEGPAMSVCILKYPLATSPWKVESRIKEEVVKGTFTPGKEDVTVPLGKFQTVTASGDLDVGTMKIAVTYYFAKDVGMVKQTIKYGDKPLVVLELEKFEPGK